MVASVLSGWTIKKKITEEQIIEMIKEQESGSSTADVHRKHGVSEATFYKHKSKYGGIAVSDTRKLRALEGSIKLKKKAQTKHSVPSCD